MQRILNSDSKFSLIKKIKVTTVLYLEMPREKLISSNTKFGSKVTLSKKKDILKRLTEYKNVIAIARLNTANTFVDHITIEVNLSNLTND